MIELSFISSAQAMGQAGSNGKTTQLNITSLLPLILIIVIVIFSLKAIIKKMTQNKSNNLSSQLKCEECMLFYDNTEKFCKKCGQKLKPIRSL